MLLLSIIILTLFFVPCRVAAAERSWQKSFAEGTNHLNAQAIFQAEICFRQAVKEVELTPHTAEDKVKCLNGLANVLTLENKTDAAAATYRKSLDILEKTFGNSSRKLLPTLFAIGSINESVGDHKAAMAYYKRAIAINERHCGPPVSTAHKIESQQQLPLSALIQQPGLDASKTLENLLPHYDEDLLTKEEASDQDLISGFQSEITKTSISDSIPSKITVSSNIVKHPSVTKSSRGI